MTDAHGDWMAGLACAQEHAAAGRLPEAVDCIERALEQSPGQDAGAWNQLAGWRHALGRLEGALLAAERVVHLAPASAGAWCNRGLVLDALGRPDAALASFDRALAVDPGSSAALSNRAKVLVDLQRMAEALAALDAAVQLAPALVPAWSARSVPLRALGRLPEALQSCDRALALDARSAVAWGQRGWILMELGRYAEADLSLGRALELAPGDAQARYNRGLLHLTTARLASGWEGYEARSAVLKVLSLPPLPVPVWQRGQEIAGCTIALIPEQGYGDIIQFCRYASVLESRGARVVVLVPPALQRLLLSLGGDVRVLAHGDAVPPVDLQCPLLSVMHRLDTGLDTIPAPARYLTAPEPRVQAWRQTVASAAQGSGLRRHLGVVCSGSAGHVNDARRSIPLQRLAPVLAALGAQGVQCHLLQSELRDADLPWLQRLGMIDHRAGLTDFCETAALTLCMDAVLSVDTAVAHLAGALGVPLHLLLPANPDWRWMLERDDSPWYPAARLYRCGTESGWDTALGQLEANLMAALSVVAETSSSAATSAATSAVSPAAASPAPAAHRVTSL